MSDHATITELAASIRSGQVAATEVVTDCLRRIERGDGPLNCFRETWPDDALAAAGEIDRRVAAGDDPGPLGGVPVAIKDNIATTTGTTACGSRFLETYRSPFAATAVERLVNAGAVPIGKTNCDEFAMGSSTENCAFGATRNPWDLDRVPGGSSGGSAAAVAAGLCPVALGSDTGGSIRQPAALCGIVGVKPSYGRVSRYGLVAFGSSLDQIGPLTTNVADAALLLQTMAGRDERDSTTADRAVPDFLRDLERPLEGLRLGAPKQYADPGNDEAVNRALDAACGVYRDLGAEIVDVDLPLTRYGVATYYVIAPAEASSNLARYDGIRYGRRATLEAGEGLDDLYARSRAEGFGAEVQRRIMIGTYALSSGYYDAYYTRALKVRRLIREEYDRAFASCDAIIGPTSPIPAFPLGSKADPLTMYLCDVYTTNANIAGICAISMPGGFADAGGTPLPVGIQIQCPAFEEQRMFRIARMHERAVTHGQRRPGSGSGPRSGSRS